MVREKNIEIALPPSAYRLDKQGEPLPCGMSLADFVLETGKFTLLVEVKDPSENHFAKDDFLCNIQGKKGPKDYAHQKLVRSARDSYCWLHLMKKDHKPIIFIALIGADALGTEGAALLPALGDAVRALSRQEGASPWRRSYLKESFVVDIAGWNRLFPQYSCKRIAS